VLDGMDAVFVACSSPRRILAAMTRVGSRLPAVSSSTGRVLLAGRPDDLVARMIERAGRLRKLTPKTLTSRNELMAAIRRVRQQGFSVSADEVEIGLRSIAVPVLSRAGTVVAALGVSVHSGRMRADQLPRKFLPFLLRGGRRLETLL
jgi:IclR family pca regulon transcriptional regulator